MATVTKTFTFATTAESFVATQAASTTLSYDAATGNPAGSLKARKLGRNLAKTTSYWEWTGTWEALGVPVGATVDSVRLLSASTRCTEYTTGASSTIGPYELYDNTPTLLGTLWAGRTVTATDASWVATAAQTSFNINSSKASNSTIRIRLADQLATGNNASAAVSTYDDQVSIEVTYTVVTPVSTTDTGSLSATDASSVVPTTPPVAISQPWVGTAVVGNGTGVAATSATVNVSGATNGEVVFIFGSIGDAQTSAITAPSGWNIYAQTTEGTSGGSSSRDIILWKVKGSGDTNVTVNWTVSANYQFVPISWPNVDPSTPAENISWVNHTTGSAYPTGAAAPSGTGRWAVAFSTSRGSTAVTAWTPDFNLTERVGVINSGAPFIGLEIADTDATTGTGSRTYTASGQTASHGIAGLFFLVPKPATAPTPDVTLNVSDTGSLSATDSGSAAPYTPPPLPGNIGGVEPESHAHNPVYVDSNNNMYRITESDTASGNHPMAWKSSDGGATWTEQDSANRPSTQDMEGTWGQKVGNQIWYTTSRDDTVWLDMFNMSDHPTAPDKWSTHETIDTGLSSSGMEQWAAFARLSSGNLWIFYSDSLSGSNQQIAYRARTGTNTYGTKVSGAFGATSVSLNGPSPVLGASDLTHIFYTDQTNNHVLYRTLTSGGSLSEASQVDASGTYNFSTSPGRIAHTNPVYYDDGGVEVVTIMFADTAGVLKSRQYRNGVAQTIETVSGTGTVLTNAGTTTSDAIIAHLANDGTTVYAVWSDGATGDVMYNSRQLAGPWGTPSVLWNSGANEAWYTYVDVITRGGAKKLAYVYDVTHALDVSDLKYNEVSLTIASTPVNVTDTGTFSATDASTNASTLSRTDSGTFSATDASTNAATLARTDTGSISATDSSASAVTSASTDTGSLSATDTSSLSVNSSVALNDTGSLSAIDTSSLSIANSLGLTDTGSLSATDASVNSSTLSTMDTGSLSATDTSGLFKAIDLNDTGSISAADTSNVFNDRPTTDSGVFSAVDTSSVAVSGTIGLPVNDTGSLSGADASALVITTAVAPSDTGSISATDTSAVLKVIGLTDTGSLSATDVSANSATLARTDTGSISATDSIGVFYTTSANDTGSLSATDASSVVVSGQTDVGVNDTGSLSATDTSVVVISNAVNVNDTGSLSATDTSAVFKAIDLTDTGTFSATDVSSSFRTISLTDTGSVSATDSANVFNDRPGTDSGTFSAVDASSVVISGQTSQSGTDTGSLSGLDVSSVKINLAPNDTGSFSAIDSSAVFKTIALTDTGSISAVDTSNALQGKTVNDAGSLSATQTASVVTFESGIIMWQWNGTAMVQVNGFKYWNGTGYKDIHFKKWDGSQFS